MSEKHKTRERRRRSRSRSRSPSNSPPQRRERGEDWRNVRVKEEPLSDVEGRRSHKRERTSPPSHHRSSRERGGGDRDRRERDYHHRRDDRDRDRPIKSEPGSRSPKKEEFVRPGQRPNHSRREDDRKRAPRGSDHDRNSGEGSSRPNRDVKREKDWNNFFNPDSDMSRQAAVKEGQTQAEREQRMEEYGGGGKDEEGGEVEKEKPNFGLSGKLTEETNTYRGVVIKYSEPPEARKPLKTRWRLYPFKEGESLEVMYIHRQSAYLLGRERKIADIPIDHPSCSKQHAVIQYRLVPYEKPNGSKGRRIRPYIIDLESANGTLVNGKRIEAKRYVELMEKDVLKFGFSSREYVVLHDQSKDDDPSEDEEVIEKSPSPE